MQWPVNVVRILCYLTMTFSFFLSCSPLDIREEENVHLIDGVPFHPQKAYQCGPASLASVLNYYGTDASPDEIAQNIYSASAGGTLNIDMVLYAERKGLKARQYSGNIRDIKENVDSGNPLIVMVDYGFSVYQRNHFMVVVGYSQNGIIAHSGGRRFKVIQYRDFEKTWRKTNLWSLLVYPEERI